MTWRLPSVRPCFKWLLSIHRADLPQTIIIYGPRLPGCCLFLPWYQGMYGSTSGGVKNLRLLIMFQNIRNQFRQMLHPRAILPVHINNDQVPVQTSALVYTFFTTYLICIFIGWTLLMGLGVGLTESFSTVISAIGNVGPGLGAYGPVYSWASLPDAAKWVLSALMLIGRLEIFSVLLLFAKRFWADY